MKMLQKVPENNVITDNKLQLIYFIVPKATYTWRNFKKYHKYQMKQNFDKNSDVSLTCDVIFSTRLSFIIRVFPIIAPREIIVPHYGMFAMIGGGGCWLSHH